MYFALKGQNSWDLLLLWPDSQLSSDLPYCRSPISIEKLTGEVESVKFLGWWYIFQPLNTF